MKVADLIMILNRFNPEDEVVIHRDVDSYGYGYIDRVVPGAFYLTDYGNDFYPNSRILTNHTSSRAICLFAEASEDVKHIVKPLPH